MPCPPSLQGNQKILVDPDTHHEPHESSSQAYESLPKTKVTIRRNPARDRYPPSRLADYVTYTAKYPLRDFITYKNSHHLMPRFLVI